MAARTPTNWICVTVENRDDSEEQSEEQCAETNSQGQCLVLLNKHKWQKQCPGYIILQVFFMEPAPDGNEDEILGWMNEWSKHCGVEFKRTTYIAGSSIRITFKKGGGNHSLLGTEAKQKGREFQSTMNLENVNRRTVLHETGHALGFGHEHQNPHVTIQWNHQELIKHFSGPPNKWTPSMIKKNITDLYTKGESSASKPADPKSIMAYQLKHSWVMNSNIVPPEYFNENTELSEEDKRKAASWYPKPKIPGLPDPILTKPQPPTLVTGGGIPSNDVEQDAPPTVVVKKAGHVQVGMRAEEKSALQEAHVKLIEGMNPTALKDPLYNKKLLTTDEYEMLDTKPTTSERNRYIVMRLPRKGSSAFRDFIACLRDTSDQNEAHTELADQLESCLHDE